MKGLEKLRKARAGLILDRPFFGSVALRLNPLEDQSCETMWTDGKNLGFNSEFVNSLSLDELKFAVAHEVMHIASFHHTRRENRDHQQWNEAADYAINGILKNSKFSLPEGVLYNSKFDNLSSEEVYNKIKKSEGKQGEDKKGEGKGDSKKEKNKNIGEVRDFPGEEGQERVSEADLREQESEVKVILTQALQADKMAGSLSTELDRFIKDLVEPKLSWKEILRRFVEQTAKNDYSWFPPNRRYIHQGLYLPSCKSDQIGNIVLSIDTSGSISQIEIDSFAAEISSILEEFEGVNLTVIYCDSRIKNVEEVSELPVKLHPAGGGGTNFIPPFRWVEDNDKNPVCMIYLTDGCCSSYPDEPGYPTLWVGTRDFEPKFGEFIRIEI